MTAALQGIPSTDFGAQLRHARLLHDFTLRQLSGRARSSESAISKLERNLASPSLTMLHRLALDTNMSDLTARERPDTEPVLQAGARPMQPFNPRAAHGVRFEKPAGYRTATRTRGRQRRASCG